jgi:hypothetical protein
MEFDITSTQKAIPGRIQLDSKSQHTQKEGLLNDRLALRCVMASMPLSTSYSSNKHTSGRFFAVQAEFVEGMRENGEFQSRSTNFNHAMSIVPQNEWIDDR